MSLLIITHILFSRVILVLQGLLELLAPLVRREQLDPLDPLELLALLVLMDHLVS